VARILVVDDDPGIRRSLSRVLERRGHQLQVAPDGRQGLRLWREGGADVVLLDIHMPEVDGIEVLVQLRGLAPELPVIVMSGGDQTRRLDLLGDAHLLGAWALLRKPFTLDEVIEVVERAVRAIEGPRDPQGQARLG
jgi:DNA-binding NtrC family response regulator